MVRMRPDGEGHQKDWKESQQMWCSVLVPHSWTAEPWTICGGQGALRGGVEEIGLQLDRVLMEGLP